MATIMQLLLIWFNPLLLFSLLLHITHPPFAFSLQIRGNETDKLSLLTFKSQIKDDPSGVLSSWNDSIHFCNWSGVKCGIRHQRIIELDLHSSLLQGTLSTHIGNLSFLRTLNLENNSFKQNIPQELGHLFRLQTLSLANNTFIGEIPFNISRCSNLIWLDLSGNNLTGKLPAEFGSLSKLQVFVFRKNNLVGEMPHSFGNLSSIEKISGAYNNLEGSIPNSIGKLKRLSFFALGVNSLTGTIPFSIYNISSLVVFSVVYNQIHGILPHDLFQTLPNLETLNLGANSFTGSIPYSISNASKLLDLEISLNNFTGKVPITTSSPNLQVFFIDKNFLGKNEDDDLSFLYSLANKTSLELLSISDNNLGGVMPEIISNFSRNLRQMVFGANQIRGSIPTEIGNLIGLEAVGFEQNQLTGFIPSSIGKLQNLLIFYVNENKITGSIPSSLGNVSSLGELSLSQNGLQGSIPSSLGNCQSLLLLDLSYNNLSGSIPKEVISISSISMYLQLSENQLTGSLPSEVGKLVRVGILDISKNKLSGVIPTSLGSCKSMESLHLEENFFQGTIPLTLSSLRSIKNLNLSYNNLTGQIPKFFGDFKLLENLDLSFNNLEGEVPRLGVFKNASAALVMGNNKLCGGIQQLNLSECSVNELKTRKSLSVLVLVFIVGCVFLGITFMTCFLYFSCMKRRKNKPASTVTDTSPSMKSFWRVTYEELLQATDGFSSSNLVGVGGFGSVYKGILVSDGTVLVAVKVLNLIQKGASKSFIAECKALTNIKHRNLVKVLTACSSIDFKGNDFKALVYEFMVNGSLEEWLHSSHTTVDEESDPKELNLVHRLNIAIDVASALDYLHHHCQIPVVHCDLKPSNVLLDAEMIAHVGDFGLSRFLVEAPHPFSPSQTGTISLKGSIGYAAPEYGTGRDVSTYGDVYSYGILLLELFTRKRPRDEMFKNGMNLHRFARQALPDKVLDVVDPILLQGNKQTGFISFEKMDPAGKRKIMESLIAILQVGVACSAELPRQRMDMSIAVAELHRVREVLIPAGILSHHREVIDESEGPSLLIDGF